MPSLKHLKRRINSIRSSQKITAAMKLVSGSKFRQTQPKLALARSYSKATQDMLHALYLSGIELDEWPIFFRPVSDPNAILLIVISSERGLCGAFNSHIIRTTQQFINKHSGPSQRVDCLFMGRKAQSTLQRATNCRQPAWHTTREDAESLPQYLQRISQQIIHDLQEQKYQAVYVVYSHFGSSFMQKATLSPCLPFTPPESAAMPDHAWTSSTPPMLYDFEPDLEKAAVAVAQQALYAQLYDAVIEAAVSEHAARMMAMDNASRNARELIEKLTVVYNRTRQASITKELTEIISGAEAT